MGSLLPLYLYHNNYNIRGGQSQRKKPTEMEFSAFLCILFCPPLNVVVAKQKTPISTPSYGKVAQKFTTTLQGSFWWFLDGLHNLFSFILKGLRVFRFPLFSPFLFCCFFLYFCYFLFIFNKNCPFCLFSPLVKGFRA